MAAGDKPARVVLDLDFTFWPYHAALAKYAEPIMTKGSTAKAGELRTTGGCITPFYQALKIVKHLHKVSNLGRPWPIAIASANRQSDRCRRLLKQMGLVKTPEEYGGIVPKLMVVHPMTTGTKKEHFERIQKEPGVSYDQMLFLDAVESNVESVQELGVICGLVGSSTGLTFQAFVEALERWRNRGKPAPETPFKPLAPKPKVPAVPKVEKEKGESSQGQGSDKEARGKQRPVTPPRGPPKGSVGRSGSGGPSKGAVSCSASAELQSRQARAAKPETAKTESREPSQSSRVVAAKSGFPTAVNPTGLKAPEFLSATEEAHSSDSLSKKNPSSQQGGTPKRPKPTLPAASAKGAGMVKPAKRVFLNMSVCEMTKRRSWLEPKGTRT